MSIISSLRGTISVLLWPPVTTRPDIDDLLVNVNQ